MRKHLMALALLTPGVALASDPTPLLFVMLGQLILYLWPIVLPLFFMKGSDGGLKTYFMFLLVTLGARGLVSLPVNLYTGIGSWLSLPVAFTWSVYMMLAQNVLSLVIAVVLLKLLRKRLALRPGTLPT